MNNKFIIVAILSAFLVSTLLTGSVLAKSARGETMSQQHKNKVEKIIRGLSDVAEEEEDKDVAEVVEEVAKGQEDLVATSTQAIEEIEGRGKVKTFFIGTDYKNLGNLRSTMVTTENHIFRLIRTRDRVTDQAVKDGLDAQITELADVASSTNAFVQKNENKLSLFGWFVKLFFVD